MTRNWLRRALVAATCLSVALLAACGSSTTESAIAPTRFVSFGDGLSDVGQGGSRYTVNDGSVNIWTQQIAANYKTSLAPVSAGGLSYARGNARVLAKPDAAGNAATPTVKEQVDAFLVSGKFGPSDVVLMNGGVSDVIALTAAFRAGSQTAAQTNASARQAGRDLAAQVRRLVEAGAKYVVVSGTYDLGKTPWATAAGQTTAISNASSQFNEGLLVDIVDLGGNVLYVDAAFYINLLVGLPGNYSLDNSTAVACNSVDAGPGIGIGNRQINSALCNISTLAVANYNRVVFADSVYLAPAAQRLFGSYAYDRLRTRF